MSTKIISRQRSARASQGKPRPRITIAVALALSLVAGGVVLARRASLWSAMSQNASGKQGSSAAPEGFAAGSPAKEYIFAGGRLVATEEPAGAPTPPAAPTGLTATAGNAQVSLAWNASSGATSYNVKRSTVTGGPYTTIATGVTATSYTDPGLTNGTAYYYVVSAVNTAGESPNSNQASATPMAGPTPPPAPTGLTATAGNAQVSLSWNASSGATSYNVKRSTVTGGPYTTIATGVTATTYTNTGLTNGTTYYYVVSAVNTAGESPDSTQVSATPTAGPSPPAAPTGLTATAGNAQVSLSWNASSGATSYNVKRSTVTGGPYTTLATGVTATSYINTGLTNGTTYYYVVSAVDTGGESPNSTQVSATPTAGGGGCSSASISPSSRFFGSSGGTSTFTVSNPSPSGCTWTAAPNVSWITITSGGSGTGNGTVTYSVAANATGVTRTGKIFIGTAFHSVSQTP